MWVQFGTHDVVVLKPNKADPGSAALGQGVVYRLKVCSSCMESCVLKKIFIFMLRVAKDLFWFLVRMLVIGHKQDSSIIVAFDDIPEDGLNIPLRLEKVANEVFNTPLKVCLLISNVLYDVSLITFLSVIYCVLTLCLIWNLAFW